nr:uncharacterized protein LOC129437615 isoform X2 [Misgurnus anguillicaudatus]
MNLSASNNQELTNQRQEPPRACGLRPEKHLQICRVIKIKYNVTVYYIFTTTSYTIHRAIKYNCKLLQLYYSFVHNGASLQETG